MSVSQDSPTAGTMHQASTPNAKNVVLLESLTSRLEGYVQKMGPGQAVIDTAEGVLQQFQLWRTIRSVLDKKDEEFTLLFSALLKFVSTHRKGAFSEKYAFRFFDDLSLTGNERRNFERMMNLLLTTCDPRSRSVTIKQVNLESTLQHIGSEEIRQRVTGFYLS